MSNINISDIDVVRAWKDEEYRNSLTEVQRAQLPDNPAELIDLADVDIAVVRGGFTLEIPGFDLYTVNDDGCYIDFRPGASSGTFPSNYTTTFSCGISFP